MSKGKRILSLERKDLAAEWDFENNTDTCTPETVTVGSGQKVWWICPHNHSYQMAVYKRNEGAGCPYCGNRKILSGFNDLKTVRPELVEEWDYQNNKGVDPETIGISYRKKVSWVCKDCGNRWIATVISRTHTGCGCPICANRRISAKMISKRVTSSSNLAVLFPELLKEWNPENKYNPQHLSAHSSISVSWKCQKGHSWIAKISDRTRGSGCPVCAGKKVQEGYNDLQTIDPLLAKEWCYRKNGDLLPTQVTVGSNRKIWWNCKHGHEYEMTISNRRRGLQCPFCSGKKVLIGYNDLFTTNPELQPFWDSNKNALLPTEVSSGSNKTVNWKCPKCNGEWRAKINNMTNGQRCPFCAGKRVLV